MGARALLQEKIYTIVSGDATLQTLLGGTASDKRVYAAYQPVEKVLTTSAPAFVVIFHISTGNPFLGRESFRYQFSIFSRTNELCERIADRIDSLLNRQSLSATGWTDVSVARDFETTFYNDDEKSFRKVIDFMVRVY